MKKYIHLFVCFLFFTSAYTQTTIKGVITDSLNSNTIPFASILLQNQDSIVSTTAYTYANDKGVYSFKTNKVGRFNLVVSALGYKKKVKPITINSTPEIITKNVVLIEQSFELNEVILRNEVAIKVKEDTIIYNAKKFIQGNEEVVEDLLKKLPGVEVDENGKITVNNQEIERLTVDGDDLFEKGYALLSKNLPVHPIESIEVYKNYSNNKLLKGIEDSKKIAMNLTLKEEAKNIWFGNAELGQNIGFDSFYSAKINLANFGKKNKYYFLTNLNNTGDDVIGEIKQLIKPFRFNEPGSLGDNQTVNNWISLSSFAPTFKKTRTNFNNAELLSLNSIFNLSEKLKIKTLGFFNSDENDFFRDKIQNVINLENNIDFTNVENTVLRKKNRTAFGKLDIIYDLSKTQNLTFFSKYNHTDLDDRSNLLFNDIPTTQELNTVNTFFDQKITYSNKFKENKAIVVTGRYINEKSPQKYSVNQFLFQDLFADTNNANAIEQESKNQYQFTGIEGHLFNRLKNGHLLEIKGGNQLRIDDFTSIFTINNQDNILLTPRDFQNNLTYTVNDLYLSSKYALKLYPVTITGDIGIHQLFNSLQLENTLRKQTPFFVNPKLRINWKINDKNRMGAFYNYNTTNADLQEVVNNYSLVGFRSFLRGAGEFNQLTDSKYNLSYTLGNFGDRFFANASLSYTKNHDYFSTNSIITQNYDLIEKIIINNQKIFNVFSTVDYYIKSIKNNIKLNLSYTKSDFQNQIDNNSFRDIISNNYDYDITLGSAFNHFFNYQIGTKWVTNIVDTNDFVNKNTNNISFVDISLLFNERFTVDIKNERYNFGNLQNDSVFYFTDINAKYEIKKNKFTLFLDARNLFNIESFKNFTVNDISTSTVTYRLLPRFILLKLKYRF